MYYKDDNVEIRIGLGLKEIKTLSTTDILSFTLTKVNYDSTIELIENFSTNVPLSIYPKDGNYMLEVQSEILLPYTININISDDFLKSFIAQIESSICSCQKASCLAGQDVNKLLKQHRLFNTTFILPNTIRPFTTGEAFVTNSFLASFIQLYFNTTMVENKVMLAEEYFNYNITGTTVINSTLFNTIIIANYLALYYYYKKLLFLNTDSYSNIELKNYTYILDTFFTSTILKNCISKYKANIDFETIVNFAYDNTNLSTIMNQNNYSRSITIKASQLDGVGTLKEQIVKYINLLAYIKEATTSDLWINYVDDNILAS